MKRVELILKYDIGNYEDDENLSNNPKDWEEFFYQSDILICDMDIIGVKITC